MVDKNNWPISIWYPFRIQGVRKRTTHARSWKQIHLGRVDLPFANNERCVVGVLPLTAEQTKASQPTQRKDTAHQQGIEVFKTCRGFAIWLYHGPRILWKTGEHSTLNGVYLGYYFVTSAVTITDVLLVNTVLWRTKGIGKVFGLYYVAADTLLA